MPSSNSEKISAPAGESRRKSYGCIMYSIIFFFIWLAGAWGLWHISRDHQPLKEKSESSTIFFEIIPGSDERTSVDDDMEDRRRAKKDDSENKNK